MFSPKVFRNSTHLCNIIPSDDVTRCIIELVSVKYIYKSTEPHTMDLLCYKFLIPGTAWIQSIPHIRLYCSLLGASLGIDFFFPKFQNSWFFFFYLNLFFCPKNLVSTLAKREVHSCPCHVGEEKPTILNDVIDQISGLEKEFMMSPIYDTQHHYTVWPAL